MRAKSNEPLPVAIPIIRRFCDEAHIFAAAARLCPSVTRTGKPPMRNNFAGSSPLLSISRLLPTRDNSDEALIAKIAAGNRLAMQVLYARHHTRVHRFLLRWTGDAATAEELTAEVFLSAWRHADRFDGSSTVSTSLIAIARRKAQRESPSPTGDE